MSGECGKLVDGWLMCLSCGRSDKLWAVERCFQEEGKATVLECECDGEGGFELIVKTGDRG